MLVDAANALQHQHSEASSATVHCTNRASLNNHWSFCFRVCPNLFFVLHYEGAIYPGKPRAPRLFLRLMSSSYVMVSALSAGAHERLGPLLCWCRALQVSSSAGSVSFCVSAVWSVAFREHYQQPFVAAAGPSRGVQLPCCAGHARMDLPPL